MYVVYALVVSTGREYGKFQNFQIPKIYFRNPVLNSLSENFSFQKFPAISYTKHEQYNFYCSLTDPQAYQYM